MRSRSLACAAVAVLTVACVSDFPAIEPSDPQIRMAKDRGLDRAIPDQGRPDQRVNDMRVPEPEAAPELDMAPEPAPEVDAALDAAPPPPVPDMAPPSVPFVRFDAVASGRNFSCGRRAADKRVLCWGENNHGQLDVPGMALSPFGLGYDHGCGYDADAFLIRCWGRNNRGQANRATGALDVRAFVGGEEVTCGLTDLGFGCLGKAELVKIEADVLRSIAVGEDHVCAFKMRGDRPACWGDAGGGRHAVPGDFLLAPDSLVASRDQTCGRVLGVNTLACWGPGDDPPDGFYRALFPSAGDHLCAIDIEGTAVCWGEDDHGQATPPPGVEFAQLAGGAEHTCGLDTAGQIHCWGRNNKGQLAVPQP